MLVIGQAPDSYIRDKKQRVAGKVVHRADSGEGAKVVPLAQSWVRMFLTPTCSYYRKWCGSDDDVHTNTGRESPFRSKWSTPTTCSDHTTLVDSRLAMQLFFSKPSLGQLFVQFYFFKTLPSLQGLGRS